MRKSRIISKTPGLSALLFLAWTLAWSPARANRVPPWPPRGYACPRATGSVVIDGRIDEAEWAAAPWTTDFVDIEGRWKPRPRFRTRARMMWDDHTFFVAAEMDEPHLWATLRERDSIIFHDNDFEVFIDPDGDSHLYTEIEMNALNTVWDLLLVRPYRDGGPAIHAWDIPGLKTAVRLQGTLNDPADTDTGWTVEMAIPFAVLDETTDAACPPRPGDRWRLNFSRVEWRLDASDGAYAKQQDEATGQPLSEDNWVWSPQRHIAMHEPEYWGIVEFVETAGDTVAATPADRIAWALRQISYGLARTREAIGRYPADPPLSAGVTYIRNGDRFTLSATAADGAVVSLDETGHLSVTPVE